VTSSWYFIRQLYECCVWLNIVAYYLFDTHKHSVFLAVSCQNKEKKNLVTYFIHFRLTTPAIDAVPNARFEVLVVATMKNLAFWCTTPCSLLRSV